MSVKDVFRDLCHGRHFALTKVHTSSGPKEILRRRSEEYIACKVLTLIVPEHKVTGITGLSETHVTLPEFCRIILNYKLQSQLTVPILSVDRPVSYFFKSFSSQLIYELPGGVVSHEETFVQGGLREMREELRTEDSQVVASATIFEPAPFDGGSHAELMGMIAVLIKGEINPIDGEGIKPKMTKYIPFSGIPEFLSDAKDRKRLVEGYLQIAYPLLQAHMTK